MINRGYIRKILVLCLLAVFFIPLCLVAVHAQDADTSFAGVYQVSGSTSEGDGFSATVIVSLVSEGFIQFQTRISNFPVTVKGPANWVSPDKVIVPVSQNLFLASGSGNITLTRTATGWNFLGNGSGQVMGTSGSATLAGTGGGVHPTRSQVSDVTGVSPTVLAIDEAVKPLTPEPARGDLELDERAAAIIFTLFYIFILIFYSLVLGKPISL